MIHISKPQKKGKKEKVTIADFYRKMPPNERRLLQNTVRLKSGLQKYRFYYRLRTDTWSPYEFELIVRTINNDLGYENIKFVLPKGVPNL